MFGQLKIKLPIGRGEGADVHGFYRTAEGRKFLREMYPVYKARETFGERKIVTLISDVSHLDQDTEYDNTRSALRRWSSGQGEMWKESEKTLRVMRRLEWHMMRLQPIREVLDDQAAEIRKFDTGNSLAILLYGSRLLGDNKGAVPQLLNRNVGLFQMTRIVEHLSGTARTTPNIFAYYRRPPEALFLLTQHFWRREQDADAHEMNDRWVGFAYPMPSGEIFRFLIDYARPEIRNFEMMLPVESDYYIHREMGPEGVVFDIAQSIFSFDGVKKDKFTWDRPNRRVNHSRKIDGIGDVKSDFLDKLSWDIPL